MGRAWTCTDLSMRSSTAATSGCAYTRATDTSCSDTSCPTLPLGGIGAAGRGCTHKQDSMYQSQRRPEDHVVGVIVYLPAAVLSSQA